MNLIRAALNSLDFLSTSQSALDLAHSIVLLPSLATLADTGLPSHVLRVDLAALSFVTRLISAPNLPFELFLFFCFPGPR